MPITNRQTIGLTVGTLSLVGCLFAKAREARIICGAISAISFVGAFWPKFSSGSGGGSGGSGNVKKGPLVKVLDPLTLKNLPGPDDLVCDLGGDGRKTFSHYQQQNRWVESKRKAYTWVAGEQPLDDEIQFEKVRPVVDAVEKLVFPKFNGKFVMRPVGEGIRYLPSRDDEIHWGADFADPMLGGGYGIYLCRQEEIIGMESPGLLHLFSNLTKKGIRLNGNEVALIVGAKKRATFHPRSTTGQDINLYGTGFFSADTTATFPNNYLEKVDEPYEANIFAFAAPEVRRSDRNQPYRRGSLAAFFVRAFAAFKGIREKHQGKKVVIHTGNWGCGAFGNDLKVSLITQYAAAVLAGIDEVQYYPWKESDRVEVEKGRQLLPQVLKPKMTVAAFLTKLATDAKKHDLLYREKQNG